MNRLCVSARSWPPGRSPSVPPVLASGPMTNLRGRALLALSAIAMTAGMVTVSTQGQGTRKMYVVATAHLDSQWNWTVQDTIRDYVPKTSYTNFELLREVPELRLQLGGRDPLHVDQGVLPGRLGPRAEVRRRRTLAAVGFVDQRGRRQHAVARVAVPAGALRPALLPRRSSTRSAATSTCPTASGSASHCRRSRRTPG